ncbi:ATP-binding protein [Spirosoma pollinicola]|uniref:histidine kinase n=1 Tax=Spirosoma pollinicola TaxID=2057025 RepID=A0A2K8Z1F4_9BACT|nr:ATP-binding protein [Spirosoma pollinicola]AUD03685.1 hypothetical protein CWM47_18735 [Spirosoma pollinicola]
MKPALFLLIAALWWQVAWGQRSLPSTRIVAVKAGNNQKDSAFTTISLSQKQPIRLANNQNYLLFSFADEHNASQKTVQYKLKGLDYAWITCTNCSQALYAHLDGGDYTFLVKPASPNATADEFAFVIEGAVWHKWWFIPLLFLYALVFVGVCIYFFVLYRFRQKLLEQRHIHRVKMASMAELTAGIAHEIQNPLNFVNNFAEVSVELMHEQREALSKGDLDEANYIADDLEENLQRIAQNGQRASNIVRGMLEHARISTGEREPTNLNALCEEYLRLAYQGMTHFGASPDHGLPARVQFACTLETNFDPSLPLVPVVPQDISRVLLNLFNNAFYAVGQKQKTASMDYQPTVTVSTALLRHQSDRRAVELRICDNGTGIPDAIKEKIFQPFFTTKPTGEGTGLGLSLSYDIITNGHGGEMTVQSQQGEGATFILKLIL